MKRIVHATAAALTALAVTASLATAPSEAQSSLPDVRAAAARSSWSQGSSDAAAQVDRAVQDGWRGAYNALPPKARAGVPEPMRPPTPKPGPEPARPGGAKEPTPSPTASCVDCVALTFDDGPMPETERLLNILDRKKVHASFFVTGVNSWNYEKTLRRVRDGGHTIGNHTDTHPALSTLGDGAIAHQIDVSNRTIRNVTGLTTHWIRPPYGDYDARVIEMARQRGLALALWDVDTADWQHRNPAMTCNIAVNNAKAGSIVLMHDIHAPTVDAVECVIDGLRAKGLRPVSLDEMVAKPEPGYIYTSKP